MVVATKVNGRITTWREWVYTFGTMDVNMKVNIRMIRNMDLEFTPGLMVDATRAIGGKANSMVLVHT